MLKKQETGVSNHPGFSFVQVHPKGENSKWKIPLGKSDN